MSNDRFDRPLARAARPHGGPETAACLDAGTLAAWTDGSLRPAERAAAEAHVADCGRCLELVAAMARTEPPPSVTSRAPWFSVRWLVPLTTAAVVVTAWVLVRDPAIVPPAEEQQKAQSAPALSAPPPAVPPAALADNAAAKVSVDALARQRAEPQGAPAAAPSFKAEAARESVDQLQGRAAMTGGVIPSPDPAVQWRFSGRSIERTLDGGRTWSTQATATADVLAGAAPASDICWIVGRSGLVMLARDGRTWQTLAAPSAGVDLVTVTATDALSAAVTTADGRTYHTIDGGRTWTLQENPAAPF